MAGPNWISGTICDSLSTEPGIIFNNGPKQTKILGKFDYLCSQNFMYTVMDSVDFGNKEKQDSRKPCRRQRVN